MGTPWFISSVSISNAAQFSDLRVSEVADSLSLKCNMHKAILLFRQVLIAAWSVAVGELTNALREAVMMPPISTGPAGYGWSISLSTSAALRYFSRRARPRSVWSTLR